MGRPVLSIGEIRRMVTVANIVSAARSRAAYRDSENKDNWPEWTHKHPDLATILFDAEKIANG